MTRLRRPASATNSATTPETSADCGSGVPSLGQRTGLWQSRDSPARAAQLITQGLTYQQVADQMGYAGGGASKTLMTYPSQMVFGSGSGPLSPAKCARLPSSSLAGVLAEKLHRCRVSTVVSSSAGLAQPTAVVDEDTDDEAGELPVDPPADPSVDPPVEPIDPVAPVENA